MKNLFLYGTLLRGFDHPTAEYIHNYIQFEGEGYFPGIIADLGSYPGALHNPETGHKVWGEIYRINDAETDLLGLLDEYEGFNPMNPESSLFIRKTIDIQQPENNVTRTCYAYLYNGSLSGRTPIPSGHYKDYLNQENKKREPQL